MSRYDKKTTRQLKGILWKWFSRFIRWRDEGQCFTCDRQDDPRNMEAGHYIPGKTCGLWNYFSEKNVHCQCFSCNHKKSGNLEVYAIKLIEKYGDGILQELQYAKTNWRDKWLHDEWVDKIKFYIIQAKNVGWVRE